MNYKMIGRFAALILAVEAFFMLPPLFIGVVGGDQNTAMSFFYSVLIALALSGVFAFLARGAPKQ